jgi:hypothetical protein
MELENLIINKKIILTIINLITNNKKLLMIMLIILVYQIMISFLVRINLHQEKIIINKIKIKKLIKLSKVLEGLVKLINVVFSLIILFTSLLVHLL